MRRLQGPVASVMSVLILLLARSAVATIVGSKHDLSSGGGQVVRAQSENEICIFCHTPHNANPAVPLWNRTLSTATYTPYTSSALNVTPGQPTGASKLCLSCHDGTIALGSVLSRPATISMTYYTMADIPSPKKAYLATDLSDDHAISFKLQDSIDAGDSEVSVPGETDEVKLDSGGEVQCSSCHNAHEPGTAASFTAPFLVKSDVNVNYGSQICLSCHNESGWSTSAHRNVTATDYTRDSVTRKVSQWGCIVCHDPHTSDIHPTILDEDIDSDSTQWEDEQVCYQCHKSGGIASDNIKSQIAKTYRHALDSYPDLAGSDADIHKVVEDRSPSASNKHVECVDCHNAHQGQSGTHSSGTNLASNVLKGMTGVSASYGGSAWVSPTFGTASPVTYEYEVCFRCHSQDGASPMFGADARGKTDIQFNINNRSHHAVIQAGPTAGINAASFVSPWGVSSKLYCSDCHESETTTDPKGPHGSNNNHIVAGSTNDSTNVCYKCHQYSVYRSGGAGSRFDHPDNNNHLDGGLNVWGNWCMNCHGGAEAGGIHGSNAGVGSSGTALLGQHFMNGAGIAGFTAGTAGVNNSGKCWTKGSSDSVNSCTGHPSAEKSWTPNYEY